MLKFTYQIRCFVSPSGKQPPEIDCVLDLSSPCSLDMTEIEAAAAEAVEELTSANYRLVPSEFARILADCRPEWDVALRQDGLCLSAHPMPEIGGKIGVSTYCRR